MGIFDYFYNKCKNNISWLKVEGESRSPFDVDSDTLKNAFLDRFGNDLLEISTSTRVIIDDISRISDNLTIQIIDDPSAVSEELSLIYIDLKGFVEYSKNIFSSDLSGTADLDLDSYGLSINDFKVNLYNESGLPISLRTYTFYTAEKITTLIREGAPGLSPTQINLFIKIREKLGKLNIELSRLFSPYSQFQEALVCTTERELDALNDIKTRRLTPEQQSDIEKETERLEKYQSGEARVSEVFPDLIKDADLKEQCFLHVNIFKLSKIKEKIDHGNSSIFNRNAITNIYTNSTTVTSGLGIAGSRAAIAAAEADAAATTADLTRESMKELPDVNSFSPNNRSVMVHGDSFGFINNLTQSPSKTAFYDMSNAEISALQPMIRLFKVVRKNDSDETCPVEKEVEIQFDANSPNNIESILQSNMGIRNPGVGLKSFNFSYEGDNPFALKKSISARLTIHANSFSELLQERFNSNGDSYTYADLALKTGNLETFKLNRQLSDVQLDNLEKLNFRLKAVVGWQNPNFSTDIFSANKGINNAINNSAITLNLTPTVHDFNVDDIGRVTFTINYLSYVEEYFDNSYFDIFTEREVIVERLKRNLKIKKLNRECNADAAELNKKDSELEETIRLEKQASLRNLLNSIIKKRKLYFIRIDPKDLFLYTAGGPYGLASGLYETVQDLENQISNSFDNSEQRELARQIVESVEVPDNEEGEIITNSTLASNSTLPFFYAGDLIDSILEDIGNSLIEVQTELTVIDPVRAEAENIDPDDLQAEIDKYIRLADNFKKLRILLGPAEIVDSDSYNSRIINLGDIPISLKHFMEWLTTRILKKEQASYSLTAFLNDFFNKYILDYMNNDTCYEGKAKQRIHLFQNSITEYRDDARSQDTITEKCILDGTRRLYLSQQGVDLPVLNVMGVRDDPRPNTGVCREINYLTYYAGRTIPLNLMNGKKEEDEKKGIWHYQIGKDRGIVKSINLSKTDSTGLAEVRFEQDGYDGLRQLRVLYDTTITTYLDVGAFPGLYIYVDPRGFDPSEKFNGIDLPDLGIGGYSMLWKTEHTIQPGMAESVLHAKWVASKDSEPKQQNTPQDTKKCSSNNRE